MRKFGNFVPELHKFFLFDRQQIDFCPLKEGDPIEEHQITVAVRKRPLNKKGNSFGLMANDSFLLTFSCLQNITVKKSM